MCVRVVRFVLVSCLVLLAVCRSVAETSLLFSVCLLLWLRVCAAAVLYVCWKSGVSVIVATIRIKITSFLVKLILFPLAHETR